MIGRKVMLLDGSSVVILDRWESEESYATTEYQHYGAVRYADNPHVITTKTLKYLVSEESGRARIVSASDIGQVVKVKIVLKGNEGHRNERK